MNFKTIIVKIRFVSLHLNACDHILPCMLTLTIPLHAIQNRTFWNIPLLARRAAASAEGVGLGFSEQPHQRLSFSYMQHKIKHLFYF